MIASDARSRLQSLSPQPGVIRFRLTSVFVSNNRKVMDKLQADLASAQLVTQRAYQVVTALAVSGNL